MESKKMTKADAVARLKATRTLTTAMLGPLGVSFEAFLAFAQVSKATQDRAIDALID